MPISNSNGPIRMRQASRSPPQSHSLARTVQRFFQSTQTTDTITLFALLALDALLEAFAYPFHRMIDLDNLAIQYPHAEVETVGPTMLLVLGCVVPLVCLVAWCAIEAAWRRNRSDTGVGSWYKLRVVVLGLFLTLSLTVFLTDVIKNAVGRPRPDLLSRCKPAANTPTHQLVGYQVCTETNQHLLHDGWRSFPSGHSSFSFSGLGYLSLFLTAHLPHSPHPRTSALTPLPLTLLPLLPLLAALLVAISRCEDYRHDVWDVCAGSALGFTVAWVFWSRYGGLVCSRDGWAEVDVEGREEGFRGESYRMGGLGYRTVEDDVETGLVAGDGVDAGAGERV